MLINIIPKCESDVVAFIYSAKFIEACWPMISPKYTMHDAQMYDTKYFYICLHFSINSTDDKTREVNVKIELHAVVI